MQMLSSDNTLLTWMVLISPQCSDSLLSIVARSRRVLWNCCALMVFSRTADALGQEEQTKSLSMVYVVCGSLGKQQ